MRAAKIPPSSGCSGACSAASAIKAPMRSASAKVRSALGAVEIEACPASGGLGADNTLLHGDFRAGPPPSRSAHSCVAIFLTGCTGGHQHRHAAHASISTAPKPDRTFAEAEPHRADCRGGAAGTGPAARRRYLRRSHGIASAFCADRDAALAVLAAGWRRDAAAADPAHAALLRIWIDWPRGWRRALTPCRRGHGFDWSGLRILALPGRSSRRLASTSAGRWMATVSGRSMMVGFADGCSGYIRPLGEYRHGGYEVESASILWPAGGLRRRRGREPGRSAVTLVQRLAGPGPDGCGSSPIRHDMKNPPPEGRRVRIRQVPRVAKRSRCRVLRARADGAGAGDRAGLQRSRAGGGIGADRALDVLGAGEAGRRSAGRSRCSSRSRPPAGWCRGRVPVDEARQRRVSAAGK